MQLRIVHTTTFAYDGKASASLNQARLTPVTSPEQILVHSRIEVHPTPWTYDYRDYYGNLVTAFEIMDEHDHLTVTATSTVQTEPRHPGEQHLGWGDLGAWEVADRWTEFLILPDVVAPPEDFASRVKDVAAGAATPADAAAAVAGLVRAEVEYQPGATGVHSLAADAWGQRAGVCQDMAHLVIGGLRSLGIPARYVSGYLHPAPDPIVGLQVTGQSHAWVEWWDGAWRAIDPTSGVGLDDRYVTVAVGRDYSDVKPLSGIYSGSGSSTMTVDVQITRLS
ncbi:transglutaminase family protein [Nocardioides sp. GY 10127]|uniref:transglutaminase family protein n=1 Tax=Nocardioides sp. GY 10127 TaxID=2569762 RepID=UPI0010A7A95B|nr:transglutaminase family protein [Nocardioides sp. GY 10127]TIC85678.1 transglutaminase family protein [Nocardioides sp. GY 10127]